MAYFPRWALLLTTLAACTSHSKKDQAGQGNTLFESDFEGLDGWVPNSPALTMEKAHSGRYAVKVDPSIEYGLTFSKTLGRLSPQRVNKLRLSAWSLVTEKGGESSLVFQITAPEQSGTNVFYDKIDLSKTDDWVQVSKVLVLPPALDPASTVRVYLWRNKAAGAVYLDDIALTVEP